jgi:hypothetical protein
LGIACSPPQACFTVALLRSAIPPRQEQARLVHALAWASDLLETIADSSEAMRDESDVVVKLLGLGRALTSDLA